jgi:long-chain fatty acid transport protein
MNKKASAAALSLLTLSVNASSLYLTELNATDVALAGAGLAARANDATTAFSNPAGMTLLEGSQYEAMVMPISLSVDFETNEYNTTEGNTDNADAWLPSGSFYYTSKINEKMAWGVAVVGYFGLGLDYDDDWAGQYLINESLLQMVGVQPSFAYQVTPKLSVGVGAVVGVSKLEQTIDINNIDPRLDDGLLTLEDEDVSLQFNSGLIYQFNDSTRLGVQYLFESELEFKDVASTQGEGEAITRLRERLGLADNETDITMTLPQMVNISLVHEVNDSMTLLSNVTWQEWSKFGKLDVQITTDESINLTAEKNYNDSFGMSVGMQYQANDKLLLSTGLAYQESIVDDKYRTPDLPLDSSIRIAFGGDYQLDESTSIKLSYGLMYLGDTKIDKDISGRSGRFAGNYDDLAMHFFSFSYASKF